MRPDDFSGHGCSSRPSVQARFRRRAPTWRLAKAIAGRTSPGQSYSGAFHQVECKAMATEIDEVRLMVVGAL